MTRAAAAVLLLLGGCASANAPASERGFFGGLGAAVTGADEQRARGMEAQATAAQNRALEQRSSTLAAQRRADASRQQLAAQQRANTAQEAEIARLRSQLADVQGQMAPDEAARIRREIDAAERDGRAAATPQQQQQAEARRQAIADALRRAGAS
jgi:hypothetical protein